MAYTLSEVSQPCVGGGYVYVATLYEQTVGEWYTPEELQTVQITEINDTVIHCYSPPINLEGYIIKYKEKFCQLQYSYLHWDAGPYGFNDCLKKLAPTAVAIVFGWVATGLIVFSKEKSDVVTVTMDKDHQLIAYFNAQPPPPQPSPSPPGGGGGGRNYLCVYYPLSRK